jgi:hypothetical protein
MSDEIDKYLLKDLGLKNVQEYKQWCKRNGFSTGLNKNNVQRNRETQFIKDEIIKREVEKSKERLQPLNKILKDIINNELKSSESQSPVVKKILEKTTKLKDQKGFLQFVSEIVEKTNFLNLDKPIQSFGSAASNNYLSAVIRIYEYNFFWINTVSSWTPNSHNSHKQFISLVKHLFCKYKTPLFLFSAWFSEQAKEVDSFICLAQGDPFKKAGFGPEFEKFTKKQAFHFLQAPDHYTIPQALRYGQIMGLGGDHQLVDAVNASGVGFDEFWDSVVLLFINNPMLDRYQVGPIIDYIKSQKFGANAPHPTFNMKGRTAASLLNQTEIWHAGLRKERPRNYLEWKPVGIKEFEKEEGQSTSKNHKIWKIVELLNSKELSKEGARQSHCVGSYGYSASSGRVSIWSLRLTTHGVLEESVVTIEVNNSNRSIVQARMKYNKYPDEKSNRLINEWANREGLTITAFMGF